MITAICGSERNVGRTTVAINLAAMLAQCGKNVVLIDASENQDASKLVDNRTNSGAVDGGFFCVSAISPITLALTVERLRRGFDEIIIDTDEDTAFVAASRCNQCLVIAGPRWDAKEDDEGLVEAALKQNSKFQTHYVFNRCYPHFDLEGWESYACGLAYTILNCEAVAAVSEGLAVTEQENPNVAVIKEMKALFEELYGEFNHKPKVTMRIQDSFFVSQIEVYPIGT